MGGGHEPIRKKYSEKIVSRPHIICYSGNVINRWLEIGSIVNLKGKPAVTDFEDINERLCTVRLRRTTKRSKRFTIGQTSYCARQ